jgi:hypothetical protein
MEFSEQKAQIIGIMRKGDKATIAREAGVSRQVILTAFRKCCVSDMTEMEMKVWNVAIDLMNDRKKELNKLEAKTAKLSEKL